MKVIVEIEVPEGESCTLLGTTIWNSASCVWKEKDGWCKIHKKQLKHGDDGVFFTKLPECLALPPKKVCPDCKGSCYKELENDVRGVCQTCGSTGRVK